VRHLVADRHEVIGFTRSAAIMLLVTGSNIAEPIIQQALSAVAPMDVNDG
jgi:hypothetical protein